MKSYATFFARRRGVVGAAVALITLAACFGLARLEFDDVPRGIFESDDEERRLLESLYEDFGSEDNDVLVLLEAEDWFRPRESRLLRTLVTRMRGHEGVESAFGMSDVVRFGPGGSAAPLLPPPDATPEDFESARAAAHDHPLVGGNLLSDDGRSALVTVRLAGDALSIEELQPRLDALRAIGAELTEVTEFIGDADGVRIRMTGVPSARVLIYDTIRREQGLFMACGSLLCFALAWALFRSLGAVIAATVPPMVGSLWALGFAGLLGQPIDLLGTVLPMLVIVIAFTDSVHLTIDERVQRAEGATGLAAAAAAIRHVGPPCALTSLTTAVGFGSLAFGNVEMIRRFGLLSAQSVLLAFLAVITIQPLLASWVPAMGRSPREPGTGSPSGARWAARFRRGITVLLERRRTVAAFAIVLTLALFSLATRLEPDNRLTEAMPRGSEAYQALVDAEEAFGGVLPAYVLVEWEPPMSASSPEVLAALGEVEGILRAAGGNAPPVSLLGLLDSLPGGRADAAGWLARLPADVLGRFVRPDRGRALVATGVPSDSSAEMLPLFARIRSGLAELEGRRPGIRLHLTGTDVVARNHVNRMITDLARSLGVAAVVIFLVIALEFRSLVLGLCSLVPNLFPLVFVGALLVAASVPLQLGTAVLFSVLLGLAVDDTIHFLARLRRERAAGVADPIERTFFAVGKAIVITTVVLFAGFAIVLASAVPTSRLFAGLVCVGLIATLLGDLVFLPALLALAGRGRPPRTRPGSG